VGQPPRSTARAWSIPARPAEAARGFLAAVGILVPIYALTFVGTLELGILSKFSSPLGFAVLAAFGQFAAYRARRYRLTRTVLRGVRFDQNGSAVGYTLRAIIWWILNTLTLGLSYPWAAASLERYKMRHTFYGDVAGQFVGGKAYCFCAESRFGRHRGTGCGGTFRRDRGARLACG